MGTNGPYKLTKAGPIRKHPNDKVGRDGLEGNFLSCASISSLEVPSLFSFPCPTLLLIFLHVPSLGPAIARVSRWKNFVSRLVEIVEKSTLHEISCRYVSKALKDKNRQKFTTFFPVSAKSFARISLSGLLHITSLVLVS